MTVGSFVGSVIGWPLTVTEVDKTGFTTTFFAGSSPCAACDDRIPSANPTAITMRFIMMLFAFSVWPDNHDFKGDAVPLVKLVK
jgi:hypothetical protein